MDNASHTVSHRPTAPLNTPLSDFRWDWTLTFIQNVSVILGAAAKRGEKKDPNVTRQLCLGRETIYQKQGVIYASLSALSRTLHVASSATSLICNCSQRSITALKTDSLCSEAFAISASTAGETIRHSWVFASSLLFRKAPTKTGH